MGRQRRCEGFSHYLRADVERGFILAYYRYVERCKVTLDGTDRDGDPFVAVAVRPGLQLGMNFSTRYQFPEEMRPETAAKRMCDKVDLLQRRSRLWSGHPPGKDNGPALRYEVWCFIPPDKKVLYAHDRALRDDLPVVLVTQDEVAARLHQTVLALPQSLKHRDNVTAFLALRRPPDDPAYHSNL